ncbi:hypothetical protein [Limnochorda pilosa]|nr:hypothetical protein [Limnochorda pilosa]
MNRLDQNASPELLRQIALDRHRRLLREAEAERALRAAGTRPHGDRRPAGRLLGVMERILRRRPAGA